MLPVCLFALFCYAVKKQLEAHYDNVERACGEREGRVGNGGGRRGGQSTREAVHLHFLKIYKDGTSYSLS